MVLDEECKDCLYNSQLKKVGRGQTDPEKLGQFKARIRALCAAPPKDYCAPLLMRDIDGIHREIFGCGIDYSRERALFDRLLLAVEENLYLRIKNSADPLCTALQFAMAANYIDFARLSDLDGQAVDYVISAAERAQVDADTLSRFRKRLCSARTLLYLHDNCGEVVLDKILIRIIKELYPCISVVSVVRGAPVINDVTVDEAYSVGLDGYARILPNGTNVPGTPLKEISPEVLSLLGGSDVVISKGLGNLETLYGEGFDVFYCFCCKCNHIARRFGLSVWSAAFVEG